MERNFCLKEGIPVADAHSGYVMPAMGADDAYLNGFLPELSFQSVLQPLSLTVMDDSRLEGRASLYSQMPAIESLATVTYDSVNQGFMKMEAWGHDDVSDQKLKMPQQERLNAKDFAFQLLKLNDGATETEEATFTEPLINFFAASPPINHCFGLIDGTNFTCPFSHLPIQKSCEPLFQTQTSYENEQLFHFHPTDSSSMSCLKKQIDPSSTTVKRCAPYRERAEGTVKRKRQRMSDKVRSLEKLLPWNRRMDTPTMLEEAYKYVKFLQAQIRVLQAMPVHSTGSCSTINSPDENPNINEFGGGVLATLNRQQLLEVVMNSPGAHTVLYSRGTCVYSMEQLLLLKKMVEKAAMDQILFPSSQY